MSYEHGTPFVNLPQTVGTDPRDWFDTNEAFADLDTKLKTAYEGAEGATQDIEAVKADILNLEQADTQMTARVDGIDSRVGANEQGISRLTGEIADVDTDLKDSICAIEEASATAAYQHLTGTFFWYNDTLYKAITDIGVGNQIVPDANCTTTNITTELLAGGGGGGSSEASDVSLAPISGMSATNVQDGISELNSDLTDIEEVLDASTAGTPISLSLNVPYTTQSDGYLVLSGDANAVISVYLRDSNDTLIGLLRALGYGSSSGAVGVHYVRKGLKLELYSFSGGVEANFVPLT